MISPNPRRASPINWAHIISPFFAGFLLLMMWNSGSSPIEPETAKHLTPIHIFIFFLPHLLMLLTILICAWAEARENDQSLTQVLEIGCIENVSLMKGTGVGLILFLTTLGSFSLMEPLYQNMQIPDEQQSLLILFKNSNLLNQCLFVMMGVVLVPISEELVFRLVFYRALNTVLSPALAMLFSSLAFSIAHNMITTIVPFTIFALIQHYAFIKTGRLLIPITAHMTYNSLVFTLALNL